MDAAVAFVFAHPLWVWLAIGAVFLAVELTTGSGWLLWPAGAAALTGVATLVAPDLGTAVQIALFATATIASTYAGRRLMRARAPGGADINDPHSRLIGRHGEACAPFAAGLGRVFVDGKEWSAELEGAGPVAAGAKVEVTAVLGGARLRVRAAG